MNTRLILGETIEEMEKLIAEGITVDMIAADLPYGTTSNKWDSLIDFEKLWSCYWRILKPTGIIALTASQPFTSALIMSVVTVLVETGFELLNSF